MGTAKASPIDNRSQLIYALTEVAEIEHVLMCQYLFAAFSLKTRTEEFPNRARRYHQVELAREWKRVLLTIAREEMQHLAFAMNLLVSVGGAPYLSRPNFPNSNRFFRAGPDDPGLEMSLERFGRETIRRFVRFETNDPDADSKRLAAFAGVPDPNYYETLSDFYRRVRAGFTESMFVPLGAQYDPVDDSGRSIRLKRSRNIPNIVRSVREAHSLIDLIVVHGEGSSSADPDAHLNAFRNVRDDLDAELAIDRDFEPSRNVVPNPLTRLHDDIASDSKARYTVIPQDRDGGLQRNLLQLFNGAYEVQLGWLYQLFARQGSADELRAIETLAFLPYMSEVIRPLGELLVLVPAKIGTTAYLGASFEVTSNNFLAPAATVTPLLTTERLNGLATLADAVAKGLSKYRLADAEREFEPIRHTLHLLRDEFTSRLAKGWPPRLSRDPNSPDYAEEYKYSEVAGTDYWLEGGPLVLAVEFQGWAQVRLATDPDGAAARRGCTGNAFAIGDEPDLDRVIRLQPSGTTVRSHCPQIGVRVVDARLMSSPLQPMNGGQLVRQLINATVNVLGSPRFEGSNHLVSEDGEPIDPFELEICAPGGLVLRRRVNGIPITEMSPAQRRGSGRFPVNLQVSTAMLRENMRRAAITAPPDQIIAERIRRIEADLAKIPQDEQVGEAAEALRFRLSGLKSTRLGHIRWTRYFFDAEYLHTISGPMVVTLPSIEPRFKVRVPTHKDANRWLVNYHFGYFDTDALSTFMFGTLWIPVDRE